MGHPHPIAFAHAVATGSARFVLRALAPVVAAVVLVSAPAVAQAAFTGTGTGSLAASTYAIPAPASMSATFVCLPNGKQATVTVAGYSPVARATAYQISLTAPDGSSSATTTILPTAVLAQASKSAGNRIYTVTIQATIGSWVGSPLTQTHTC
ncbi:hypothetical protein [Sinomonas sp. G460-2]|uniref:hypothetical protein n=1 Tax=Sinomonas sp. G460-2 TaxID=3393464 RepID=UPI0039F00BAC